MQKMIMQKQIAARRKVLIDKTKRFFGSRERGKLNG